MADGFGRMPVKPEVPAADAQIGGDGKLLSGAGTEKRAIVADTEPEHRGCSVGSAVADAANKGEFAVAVFLDGTGGARRHFLRIGHERGQGSGISGWKIKPFSDIELKYGGNKGK
jgi:hypothetical protein